MKRNRKSFVALLTACFLMMCALAGCEGSTSQPAPTTTQTVAQPTETQVVQPTEAPTEAPSEPTVQPTETVAEHEPIIVDGIEQSNMPKPLQEIVEAKPWDFKYQFYDKVFTKDFHYVGAPVKSFYLAGGYDLPLSGTVEYVKNYVESNTSQKINWVDYNPDRLIASNEQQFLRGEDDDGALLYVIWAYNESDETKTLKECVSTEMRQYSNVPGDDFGDEEVAYDKYRYIFGGINVFSGEWDYYRVKEVLSKYPELILDEYTANDKIQISVALEFPNPKIEYDIEDDNKEYHLVTYPNTGDVMIDPDTGEVMKKYIGEEIWSRDNQYHFSFDPDTGKLVHMYMDWD